VGEPFRGAFDPATLVAAMTQMGYRDIRDLGPDDLNAMFFLGRPDGLRVGSSGRMLLARGPEVAKLMAAGNRNARSPDEGGPT